MLQKSDKIIIVHTYHSLMDRLVTLLDKLAPSNKPDEPTLEYRNHKYVPHSGKISINAPKKLRKQTKNLMKPARVLLPRIVPISPLSKSSVAIEALHLV